MIKVNNVKAIEITKDRIREYRTPKLAELDVQFNKAIETGEDTSILIAQKQELRDMPTLADGKSNDELKILIDSLG